MLVYYNGHCSCTFGYWRKFNSYFIDTSTQFFPANAIFGWIIFWSDHLNLIWFHSNTFVLNSKGKEWLNHLESNDFNVSKISRMRSFQCYYSIQIKIAPNVINGTKWFNANKSLKPAQFPCKRLIGIRYFLNCLFIWYLYHVSFYFYYNDGRQWNVCRWPFGVQFWKFTFSVGIIKDKQSIPFVGSCCYLAHYDSVLIVLFILIHSILRTWFSIRIDCDSYRLFIQSDNYCRTLDFWHSKRHGASKCSLNV